jgi:hypothetical protein
MIKDNLLNIIQTIENIKIKNKINYNINLMAVSKTRSPEEINEAVSSGQLLFGENRVVEAYKKFNDPILKDKNVELHIIGHLQRNKVKKAVEISSMIQSIDKIETLDEIEKEASKINKVMDYLIEVNTSNEPQKNGIYADKLDELLEMINKKKYKFCNLRGFMTVGPLTENEAEVRKSFNLLYNLFDKTKNNLNKLDFNVLSMGMSGDYKIAIEEGSNLIRIGSLIFGARDYK